MGKAIRKVTLIIGLLLIGSTLDAEFGDGQVNLPLTFSSIKPTSEFNFQQIAIGKARITTETKRCFSISPVSGTKRITLRYRPETCGFCGKKTISVGFPGVATITQIPVEVSCQANVLLVDNQPPSSKKEYAEALSEYIQTLAKEEKLSVLAVNLNDFRYNIDATPIKNKLDLKKPETFVNAIRDISSLAKSQYVILLGNVETLPMPDIGDKEIKKGGRKECEFSYTPPCTLPSDRPYAGFNGDTYAAKIARIPMPVYAMDRTLRTYTKLHKQKGIRIEKNRMMFHVDSCGKVKETEKNGKKIMTKDCWWFDQYMKTYGAVFGKTAACLESQNCFLNPPYCLSCNGKIGSCKPEEYKRKLEAASFLYIAQHGTGFYFQGITEQNGVELTCNAGDGKFFVHRTLSYHPLVITPACYGASIDEDIAHERQYGSSGSATSLLFAGASIYIGTTRGNYAALKTNFKKGTPITRLINPLEQFFNLKTNVEYTERITKTILACKKRIGDCFYDEMVAMELGLQSKDVDEEFASRWKSRQTIRQYQLYGDPTLTIQVVLSD